MALTKLAAFRFPFDARPGIHVVLLLLAATLLPVPGCGAGLRERPSSDSSARADVHSSPFFSPAGRPLLRRRPRNFARAEEHVPPRTADRHDANVAPSLSGLASVRVISTPPSASVYHGEVLLGQTPLTAYVPRNVVWSLQIRMDGYSVSWARISAGTPRVLVVLLPEGAAEEAGQRLQGCDCRWAD